MESVSGVIILCTRGSEGGHSHSLGHGLSYGNQGRKRPCPRATGLVTANYWLYPVFWFHQTICVRPSELAWSPSVEAELPKG